MKARNFGENLKNAVGAVFLLAAAFFVCSTFLSMRAVLADPIAPQTTAVATQSPRAASNVRSAANTRQSPRGNVTAATASRGTTATPSRAVATRATAPSRTAAAQTSRAVVDRAATNNRSGANRAVIARTGTTPMAARVSLTGTAMRGSNGTAVSGYTYLQSKLYTGNYSNIIDSTTGLISADAYSNCMESYYACMDEICTARNAAQRRCACAGRVKSFADAEQKLESANEELIKVSGELALLIATKGKDVSSAFQLTDAEKVMNCVSWQDAYKQGTWTTGTDSEAYNWCTNHGIYTSPDTCPKPSYCTDSGNNFGFNVDELTGSGSDILASLKSWADAKDKTMTITEKDNNNILSAYTNVSSVVDGLTGITGAYKGSTATVDSLAKTWGYELFEYAHNNVCNRVLDSCFNGIYEACGTPPSSGRKCSTGSTCPYNYNTMIKVKNSGSYELDFITGQTGSTSNSATCFGYTSASGDPYVNLRGPVADSRRSIMQKYALDANADCDAYGEQLRTTAQNIGYQKVAAQQALQKKRLEFQQEETTAIVSDYRAAKNNFSQCLSELYECYTTQETANTSWSTSRIKTYCSTVANVPSCYEPMVCGAPNNQLEAVISKADTSSVCSNTTDASTNTCRNLVTIAEILSGSYANSAAPGSSAQLRESCLGGIGIEGVRNWSSTNSGGWAATDCPSSQHMAGNSCVPNTTTCTHTDANAATAQQTWISTSQSWGGCTILTCKTGFDLTNGACVAIPVNP